MWARKSTHVQVQKNSNSQERPMEASITLLIAILASAVFAQVFEEDAFAQDQGPPPASRLTEWRGESFLNDAACRSFFIEKTD